jgi:hypothetical protein
MDSVGKTQEGLPMDSISGQGADQTLDEVLESELARVKPLVKTAARLLSAAKGWQKALELGDLLVRDKSSAQAQDLGRELVGQIEAAVSSWSFDRHAYLASGRWRDELVAAASAEALRAYQEGDALFVPPVVLRALPANGVLRIGKTRWSKIRPRVVVSEIKRVRDKVFSATSSDFLESLYQVAVRRDRGKNPFILFREAYETFCLAPGYKRENSKADFALAIYALHESGIKTTKGGIPFQFEWPAGKFKDSDVFPVISEEGKLLRYYGIQFLTS